MSTRCSRARSSASSPCTASAASCSSSMRRWRSCGSAMPSCSATAPPRRGAPRSTSTIWSARPPSLLRSSGAVEWVLYKLDGGLDHILVDEAQDTSPVQWQVIRALAEEFFSGHGAQRQAAHAVRGRRREAVDLQLPGCRAGHVRRGRRRVRAARRAGRHALAPRAAHAVVPLGRAAAGGGRPHLRRSGAHAGADGGARARQARRQSRRARGLGRDLAD